MSFLSEIREENKKDGLFASNVVSVSYPLGFPILDELLGAIYIRKLPDGSIVEEVHKGIPAGSFTIFTGPTSSGKTSAAIQAAANIVEPFGELSSVIHRDGEKSATYDRVQALTGWSNQQIEDSYSIERDNCTWENVLSEIIKLGEKKAAEPNKYVYSTGQRDIWGNEYKYYVPTVMIIDSIMKFVSKNEAIDTINGLTAGGRNAIYNGNFFRNALEPMYKYNINVIVIIHLDDDMPAPGGFSKPKQMTFMLNGKRMSGGNKTRLLTSSIIGWLPHTSKDDISSEEVNGWNGVLTDAYILKSRTSIGGMKATMEFVQESGFDQIITLMHFAKEKGLILGRNPGSHFEIAPDVKFDTRIMMNELRDKPEVVSALLRACKDPLRSLIPVIDTSDDSNLIRSAKRKMDIKQMMRDLL